MCEQRDSSDWSGEGDAGVQADRLWIVPGCLQSHIWCVAVYLGDAAMYQGLLKLLELAAGGFCLFSHLVGFLVLLVMLVILTKCCFSINLKSLKIGLWPKQSLPGAQ